MANKRKALGGAFNDPSLEKYPSIGDYLLSKYPDVWSFLQLTKLDSYLDKIGANATVFLMPDKKTLAEFQKLYEKGNGYGECRARLGNLILKVPVFEQNDWNTYGSDLTTIFGKRLPNPGTVSNNAKSFKIGSATISVHPGFRQALIKSIKGKEVMISQAIWEISGMLDFDDLQDSEHTHVKKVTKKVREVTGKYEKSMEPIIDFLFKTPDLKQNAAEACIMILENLKDQPKLKMLLTHDPIINIYLLFDQNIVSNDLVVSAFESAAGIEKYMGKNFSDFMAEYLKMDAGPEAIKLVTMIDSFRNKIKGDIGLSSSGLSENDKKRYAETHKAICDIYGVNFDFNYRLNLDANIGMVIMRILDHIPSKDELKKILEHPATESPALFSKSGAWELVASLGIANLSAMDTHITTGSGEVCSWHTLNDMGYDSNPDIPGMLMDGAAEICPFQATAAEKKRFQFLQKHNLI